MMLTPQEQEIELALQTSLAALKAAFFDLLAGLVLLLIACISIVHSVVRFVFAGLGLLLWALALLVTFLYWLRSWLAFRSVSSLHHEREQ